MRSDNELLTTSVKMAFVIPIEPTPALIEVSSCHPIGISYKTFEDEGEAFKYAEESKNRGEFSVVTMNGDVQRPITKTILLLKVGKDVFGAYTDYETMEKAYIASGLCTSKNDFETELKAKHSTISVHRIPLDLITTGSIWC